MEMTSAVQVALDHFTHYFGTTERLTDHVATEPPETSTEFIKSLKKLNAITQNHMNCNIIKFKRPFESFVEEMICAEFKGKKPEETLKLRLFMSAKDKESTLTVIGRSPSDHTTDEMPHMTEYTGAADNLIGEYG